MAKVQQPVGDDAAPARPGAAVDVPALIRSRRYWLLLALAAVIGVVVTLA